MTFVPIANTIQVETVFEHNDQRCENVYHVLMPTPYDATEMLDMLDVFRSWWNTNMVSLVSTDTKLVNLIATDQDDQTGPRVEDATGLPIAGTAASAPLPGNVTLAIRWLTAKRGRSFRGRTYHVGLREDQVVGNTIANTPATSIKAAYAQLLVDVATAGGTLVVASRFANNAPRTVGLATPITSVFVDLNVDSQRRRLNDRGS